MTQELKQLKDKLDSAAKALGKMAGTGPIGARRGTESKYSAAHKAYVDQLRREGNYSYMTVKRKYHG